MAIDIIILSNATNAALKRITQAAIDSCHASEKDIKFNILIIEQQADVFYEGAKSMHIFEPFNYNRFMNIGIDATKSSGNEYVCLCNNDLVFGKGWATELIKVMESEYLLSASPKCPYVKSQRYGSPIAYGYRNHHEVSGWCLMTNRFLYEIIGPIDEEFPFWFADNAYSEQLKARGVKHALVKSSIVTHLGSKTLKTLDQAANNEMTMALAPKFIAKYPNNESSAFFARILNIKF